MKTKFPLFALLSLSFLLPALSFGQTVITYTTTGVLQLVSGSDKLGLSGSTITVVNTLTEGQTPVAGTNNQYDTTATITDKALFIPINVPAVVTLNYVGANSAANNIGLTGTASVFKLSLTVTSTIFVPSVSSLNPEPIASTNLTSADTVNVNDTSGNSSVYSFASGTISSNPANTCAYTVAPLMLDFPISGNTQNVNVTAGAGCPWTAISNNPWITVSPLVGTGSGTVTVTVGANGTSAQQIGSAIIAGSAVNITQDGPVVCTFSVSPPSLAFPSTGGAAQPLTISASAPTCAWTASSTLGWLSLSPTSGTGSATVVATAQPNSSNQNLTGNITVAGQAIPVSEAGTNACSFTVSPSSLLFIANGGTSVITLSASSSTCAWTASIVNAPTWITVSPTSGTGNGSVTVTVAGNGSGSTKNATLDIAGQTVQISQSNTNACTFSATSIPSPLTFVSAPSVGFVTVTASGQSCQWSVTSTPDWLVPAVVTGTGTFTLSLQATANTATTTRTGVLTVAGVTFTVSQNGISSLCNFTVTPTSLQFTNNGGSAPVTLGVSDPTCAWTATSSQAWVTVSPSNGVGPPTLPLTVIAQGNTTGQNLSATLTIAGLSVAVTQSSTACTYTVSPTTLAFPSQGGPLGIIVTASNPGCAWTASSTLPWLFLSPSGGSGSGSTNAIASTNIGNATESGSITVAGQVVPVTVASSTNCTFTVSNASMVFPNVGGSTIASVVTSGIGCAWTASAPSWITLSATGGTGSGSILITAAADQNGASQSGTVILAGTSIPVTQSGGCTFSVAPTSITTDVRGTLQPITVTASSSNCTWTAAAPTFATLTATTGTGTGSTTLSVPYNATGTDLSGTLIIANQSISVVQGFTQQVFQDVPPGSFGFDAINQLAAKKITSGCAPTLFCPNENIPRAQMAIFIINAAYNGAAFTTSQTPYFTDVPVGSFGFNQIQKMYELGLTSGCGGGKFCPTSTVTRDQGSVFLIKARYGATTVFDYPPAQIFNDVPPTYWAYAWIQRMYQDQITTGCGNNDFCPTETMTRAQMAIFIMKAIYNVGAAPGTPEIISIVPNVLATGSAPQVVTITGLNTSFSEGLTLVSNIPGVTISNIVVTGPTTLDATMTVQANAPMQPDAVYVITGSQEAVVPFGISVP